MEARMSTGTVFSKNDSVAAEVDLEYSIFTDYLEVNFVRIYPGILKFSGAYDGKKFLEKFKIINVGRVPAFVRVMQPTSQAFKMKALPKGRMISTGLSITRYVKYTYSTAIAIPQVYVSIYVNEKPIMYRLQVHTTQSIVRTYPKLLHFGEIDIGTASEQLSIHLRNEGEKISNFTVDLGRNDLELIVDPMKGIILPSSTAEIKVEILGSRVGGFLKEFWIKTDPPQRIRITGTFIMPMLTIEHPPSNFSLIVLDFPKTYLNAESIRTIIIKNSSSTDTMFCTMAELKGVEMRLDVARKNDHNLKFFIINPNEGRLRRAHKAAMIVRFAPRRLKQYTQKYCITMIKVMKVNYRDGIIKGKDIEVKTFSSTVEADQYQIGSICSIEEEFTTIEFTTNFIRICLYGEIEKAQIKLTPHSIDRDDLNVNQQYNFTFNIKNCSKYLPITFTYEKIACFEMDPPNMTLKPDCSVDALLLLKPSTIGQIDTKICLHLTHKTNSNTYQVGSEYFYVKYVCHNRAKSSPMLRPKFNMGITPAITNEVGFLVDNFRFNQAAIAPTVPFVNDSKKLGYSKDDGNIIAFPNDRPRALRPWTNESRCVTIFANLPRVTTRDDIYALSRPERKLKTMNKQKYVDLLRNGRQHVIDDTSIYQEHVYPSREEKVLLTNEQTRKCPDVFVQTMDYPKFVPLSPEQLTEIEISPHYIQLGKIAPYICCSDFFSIENRNDFQILIAIIALSNSVVVKGKKRITIGPKSSAKLYFDCFSHGVGKYYVPVYIIINDCHIFDATVFAEVVPTTVKCRHKEIFINPKTNVAYLELFNPVNCAIDFYWSVQDKNYSIIPASGSIDSRRSLYCQIIFIPTIDAVYKTDIYLFSQSGAKQIITLATENRRASVIFNTTTVEFHDIPLNIEVSENLVFRNNSPTDIIIYVKEKNPLEEITVSPEVAVVPGRSVIFFQIFAHFRTVEKFRCIATFVIQDEYEHQIEIIGQVNYPTLTIEPSFIQIPKIITGACQRKVFRMKNISSSKIEIAFSLELYDDYKILDMNGCVLKKKTLKSNEIADLFLEFDPLEPTAYTFYLPIILNNLVGPPLLNNPPSFKYTTYFNRLPSIAPNAHLTMPGLRVSCAAGAAWFRFSSLSLNFNDSKQTNEFSITNISQVDRDIRLFFNELEDAFFSLEIASFYGTYKKRDGYFKVTLNPNQEVVFLFRFNSDSHGTYEAEAPLFVNDYFGNCMFNSVKLYALCIKPTFHTLTKVVCFPTIPVKAFSMQAVHFTSRSHKPNCEVSTSCEHEFLKSEIKKRKQKEDTHQTMQKITIIFFPKYKCNLISKCQVSCTCEAFYEIDVVASASNCALLSYRHKMKFYADEKIATSTKSIEDFHFDMNHKDFIRKLNKFQQILEMYFHSQGFFCTAFYKIPETIARYPFDLYRSKEKRNPHSKERKKHLPIVTLLRNLADANILQYLTDGVNYANLDDTQGTAYDYGVYKNVLAYLEDYNMFSKSIKPKYLLTYERYLVFKNEMIDNEYISDDEILTREKFDFLSKQNWVDLLIRIYKLFHYDRLVLDSAVAGKLENNDIFHDKFEAYFEEHLECFNQETQDEGEIRLLLWLEYHFNNKKDQLWPGKRVPERTIRDLTRHVRDSLPLITLMAAYCPYLESLFKEVYFEPFADSGQLHHNACLVSEAWNKLELSFTIPTNHIVEPTNTEMIILLCYLYGVLPHFYPTETVTIKSSLGETCSVHVVLKNPGNDVIGYQAVLFSNENESFSLDNDVVTLQPKQEKDIRIFYTAKQVIKEEAVLLLSGEVGTQKFAKSTVVNLIGIPDILYFTEEYTINVNLYENTLKNIMIQSPYKQSYRSNNYFYLYDADRPPLTLDDFISINSVPNLPRQFRVAATSNFKADGTHKLHIELSYITCGDFIYYIYFMNKDVGVFCIKLTVHSRLAEADYEEIRIRIPSNFDTLEVCKCKKGVRNALCPKIIKASIPFRNSDLMSGLKRMIKLHACANEKEFWDKYLVFPKGFHIFRQYLQSTFAHTLVGYITVLSPQVAYVPVADSSNYSTESLVEIHDTTDEGTFQLLLHWDSSSFPEDEILYLKADHGMEIRKYRLIFWTREPRQLV